MKLAENVIKVTHALKKAEYLVDVDLIVAAGDDPATGSTFLVSLAGPIMPVEETKEFVMSHKKNKENNNVRSNKRSNRTRKKL